MPVALLHKVTPTGIAAGAKSTDYSTYTWYYLQYMELRQKIKVCTQNEPAHGCIPFGRVWGVGHYARALIPCQARHCPIPACYPIVISTHQI